jgi:predicted phosphoribosyltransferase
MVCLSIPAEFYAVGQFFDDFGQVSDEDVIATLRESQEKAVATSN